jgi:hypothetical protein
MWTTLDLDQNAQPHRRAETTTAEGFVGECFQHRVEIDGSLTSLSPKIREAVCVCAAVQVEAKLS